MRHRRSSKTVFVEENTIIITDRITYVAGQAKGEKTIVERRFTEQLLLFYIILYYCRNSMSPFRGSGFKKTIKIYNILYLYGLSEAVVPMYHIYIIVIIYR